MSKKAKSLYEQFLELVPRWKPGQVLTREDVDEIGALYMKLWRLEAELRDLENQD